MIYMELDGFCVIANGFVVLALEVVGIPPTEKC
jgi:hypothetical protein